MPIRTLVLTPGLDLVRTAITKTNVQDFDAAGTVHLFSRAYRPSYMFNFKIEPIFRKELESLEFFHAEHMGALSFMCRCDPYNTVENYQRFSSTAQSGVTQFFLPNRYIGASSFSLQTRNQVTQTTSIWSTAAYSLMPTPGILLFPSAVSSGHDLEAKYAVDGYRVVFEPDGLKVSEWARGVYRVELNLREVFIFT